MSEGIGSDERRRRVRVRVRVRVGRGQHRVDVGVEGVVELGQTDVGGQHQHRGRHVEGRVRGDVAQDAVEDARALDDVRRKLFHATPGDIISIGASKLGISVP